MAMDWAVVDLLLTSMSDDDKRQLLERIQHSLAGKSLLEAARGERLRELWKLMDTLPVNNPVDGLSREEHDQVFHGRPA